MKIEKRGNNYAIVKDGQDDIVLTYGDAMALMTFIRKENLRDQIDGRVEAMEEDWLDLTKYDGTRDEFIQELYDEFEDEIDFGEIITDDDIDDRICDLGTLYELEKEE